ncbi:MAG: hypothetical protein HY719_04620 [Planctomycetes bacterium]|nr:hypothetical protein [Planctomycetota bacterium]
MAAVGLLFLAVLMLLAACATPAGDVTPATSASSAGDGAAGLNSAPEPTGVSGASAGASGPSGTMPGAASLEGEHFRTELVPSRPPAPAPVAGQDATGEPVLASKSFRSTGNTVAGFGAGAPPRSGAISPGGSPQGTMVSATGGAGARPAPAAGSGAGGSGGPGTMALVLRALFIVPLGFYGLSLTVGRGSPFSAFWRRVGVLSGVCAGALLALSLADMLGLFGG